MGITSSLMDERNLFDQLKAEYETETLQSNDEVMYSKMKRIYDDWLRMVLLHKMVMFTELVSFEFTLEKAFSTGRTPLIIDESVDDRVCTFFSYQPDVIILEAKAMVLHSIKHNQTTLKDIAIPLENARRALVTAMKFGKLLVIRLGTTAPDFVGQFNDLHLSGPDGLMRDTTGPGTAYFPLEVFYKGGSLFHDIIDCSNPSQTTVTNGSGSTKDKKECTWAERLFREEDMRPHRNFALCRREFRVCVASQLPLEVVQEYLFGGCPKHTGSRGDEDRVHIDISKYEIGLDDLEEHVPTPISGTTSAHSLSIPAGYSGVLPPMDCFQLVYVNKDDD